jgi:hypothetical protein
MRKAKPQELARASELLDRDLVVELIRSYRPGAVTWSASRVLYRLKVCHSKAVPPTLARRARKILDALADEGLLRKKGPAIIRAGGALWSEQGFVLEGSPTGRDEAGRR